MGVSMPKITISGHPGSGTSTLVSGLVNHFNWRYLNGGQVFRDEAKLRNMTLEEFGELCVSDTNIDKLLDEKLRQKISDNEIEVVEVTTIWLVGVQIIHELPTYLATC